MDGKSVIGHGDAAGAAASAGTDRGTDHGAIPGAGAAVWMDPASELVRLAASLIRLQSGVRLAGAELADVRVAQVAAQLPAQLPAQPAAQVPAPAPGLVPSGPAPQNARQAAVRTGIEVLQGFGVSLIAELQDALERDAFHYVYQPVVSMATGALAGFQASMRWQRGKEAVAPPLFAPIAQASALLPKIQLHLLDDVARNLARVARETFIAIGYPLAQCADSEALSALIERAAQLRIDPARVMIEITERSGQIDPGAACRQIMRLKTSGFQLAVADFGGDAHGIAFLSRLPVDVLKVDFAQIDMTGDIGRAAVILEGVLHIARELGCRVVAEGVDSPRQAVLARQLGCELMQGRFVGEPSQDAPVAAARSP